MSNPKLDPRLLGPEEKSMLEALKAKVIGQDKAVEIVSSAFGFYISPLRNPDKPIGVFILAGPPGVGKMKVAQALAQFLFGDPMGFCYVNCDKPVPLEQKNLDRAHQQMLEAVHKEDVDKLYERGGEFMEELAKLKALEINLAKMKKDPNADMDEFRKLSADFHKRRIAYNRENTKLEQELKEAAINGWRDDEDNPPQNLLSIVFFDHVTEAEPPFYTFLEEILDTGQVAYMKDDKVANVSIKNSFVFLSLAVPYEEGKLGFQGSHPSQPVHQNIDKQIQDLITEEVRGVVPARIVDRVQVVMLNILDQASLMRILDSKIDDLLFDLVCQGVPLSVSLEQSLKDHLVKEAFQRKESGAWYLEKTVRENIEVGLMRLLKTGQLAESDNVKVSLVHRDGKDEIVFEKDNG